MNNKGQTLVIFVLLLPIFLLLFAYLVDTSLLFYEKNKLDDLNKMVIQYKMDHVEKEEEKIKDYIYNNDKKIQIYALKMDQQEIQIQLSKKIQSLFGRIVGIKDYTIKSSYMGNIQTKEIKKIEE